MESSGRMTGIAAKCDEDMHPLLAVNIIRGERLFCRDDYAADEYELYVFRRAGDLERFERQRIEQIMNSDKSG